MKKHIILLIIFFIISTQPIFAYSEKFSTMIKTMNIEIENKEGYALNEDIYNAYNQFVYGSPLDIADGQRWKNVSNGRWTKNGSIWNDSGTRGEYWVLGYNTLGNEVHNQKFPVDIEPPTPPTEWRYVHLDDAESSWNDLEKFLFEEQKEYMQTTKLYRNDIMYDITALDIGLDKARVENYPTWMTNGSIYTRRYDMNNKEWAANFIVPPLAGSATLEGHIKLINGKSYKISEDDEIVNVPINFGAEVKNLTDFAKKEHVKIITTELYADDVLVSSNSGEKALSIDKMTEIILNKNNYDKADNEIEIKLVSTLLTEFKADGALVDIKIETINLHIDGKEEENYHDVDYEYDVKFEEFPPPEITSIKLSRIVNGKPADLPTAKKTGRKFICAGQVLRIDVMVENAPDYVTLNFEGDSSIITLDSLTKRFEWDEPRERNVKTSYNSLNQLKNQYNVPIIMNLAEEYDDGSKEYYIDYLIPYGTKQTLQSWSTLREISNDAFNIDESKLFSKKRDPYVITLKATGITGKTTSTARLDVFERWDTLYNRDLTPYIK